MTLRLTGLSKASDHHSGGGEFSTPKKGEFSTPVDTPPITISLFYPSTQKLITFFRGKDNFIRLQCNS